MRNPPSIDLLELPLGDLLLNPGSILKTDLESRLQPSALHHSIVDIRHRFQGVLEPHFPSNQAVIKAFIPQPASKIPSEYLYPDTLFNLHSMFPYLYLPVIFSVHHPSLSPWPCYICTFAGLQSSTRRSPPLRPSSIICHALWMARPWGPSTPTPA